MTGGGEVDGGGAVPTGVAGGGRVCGTAVEVTGGGGLVTETRFVELTTTLVFLTLLAVSCASRLCFGLGWEDVAAAHPRAMTTMSRRAPRCLMAFFVCCIFEVPGGLALSIRLCAFPAGNEEGSQTLSAR